MGTLGIVFVTPGVEVSLQRFRAVYSLRCKARVNQFCNFTCQPIDFYLINARGTTVATTCFQEP